jgi:hypothetical protein
MAFDSDFHDGFVDGIFVSGTTARIFLRTEGGRGFTLVLRGVDALSVNDFRKGNIVFEVNVVDLDQIDKDFVFGLYGYSEQSKQNFVLTEWVENAKKRDLKAIEIIPSYGSAVSVLTEDYELIDGMSLG